MINLIIAHLHCCPCRNII